MKNFLLIAVTAFLTACVHSAKNVDFVSGERQPADVDGKIVFDTFFESNGSFFAISNTSNIVASIYCNANQGIIGAHNVLHVLASLNTTKTYNSNSATTIIRAPLKNNAECEEQVAKIRNSLILGSSVSLNIHTGIAN